jgi:alkylhydroperoxidase family enzyme
MARIQPLAPPYAPEVAEQLAAMMPPGVPPILLFRTMATNLAMTRALSGWGGYELGQDLSLTMRDREIVIDRICARCGCEYEWGVHVAFFAERCELTTEQIASLTHGSADDACWHTERDRLLIRAVDELHDTSDLSDDLYASLASVFSDAEILDLLLLCGWYHAISFVARAARVDREPGRSDPPLFSS